ncbi:hypothetical protein AAVH_24331, partial [Aphelenchoides avenae]
LESERNRRSPEEEDLEEDYVEAEIDSTDTLVPTMTELFGEPLLQKKYVLTAPSDAANVEDDETPTVPGTVPRNHPPPPPVAAGHSHASRTARAAAARRRVGALHGRGGPSRAPPAAPSPPSPPHADERTSSMMSHATYVLENDKRKPLIASCGLKSVVIAQRQAAAPPITARKPKGKDSKENSASEEVPTAPTTLRKPAPTAKSAPTAAPPLVDTSTVTRQHKPLARRRSDPSDPSSSGPVGGKGRTMPAPIDAITLAKATSTSVLNELPPEAAPVTGKMHTRLPDDASVDEYMAAFGSRPKVIRTPDQSGSGAGKKPTVMLY